MSNKENNNENKNEPVVGTENVIDDEELSKLEEFTVDNEKILLPLYDIKLQEKLDQKMGDGVCKKIFKWKLFIYFFLSIIYILKNNCIL